MRFIYNKYKGNKTIYYLQSPMALDIETSWNHSDTDPICWITSIQTYFDGEVKIFRTAPEWLLYMKELYEYYELDRYRRLMIIVHNLSYDISYLLPFLQCAFPYGSDERRMLNDGHKITCYTQGGLEFRDTFALVNKSLAQWGKDMAVEHPKAEGLYDYDKIIYPDDELTSEEELYDINDVLCLYEAFKGQLNLEGDTVATVPYTATGYNRRTSRKRCQRNKAYMESFRATKLDEIIFLACISSFAGGYVHNNRLLKSSIIKGLFGHRDFRSHYPSQLMVNLLPTGAPVVIYDPMQRSRDRIQKWTIDLILSLSPEFFTITKLYITRAMIKDINITMPFLQFSKLQNKTEASRYILDNGRVLSFEGGAFIYVDNYLLRILQEQYNLKGHIIQIIGFRQSYLPECLKETVNEYFLAKTDEKIKLKRVTKEYGEFSAETFLQKAVLQHKKAGLNGLYGMFVQSPIHSEYDVDFTDPERPLETIYDALVDDAKTVQQWLDEYYGNRNSFLQYQIGVAVTALARYELYEYIKAIGYDKVVYCDTDSIFYIKSEEVEKRIEALNRIKRKNAEKLGAYVTSSEGEKIYYDVFEAEPDIIGFKGLHSKCYGYIEREDGQNILKATIAGVPDHTVIGRDKEGKQVFLTREEELGGITAEKKLKYNKITFDPWEALANIKDDFAFKVNTGTCAYYLNQRPHEVVIDGHKIITAGGCIIKKLEEKTISDWEFGNIDFEDFETEVIN